MLAEDKQNAKALFRRGRARFLLGQSDGALKDLEAALAAAPGDGGIARELAAVRKAIKQVRQDCSRARRWWTFSLTVGGSYAEACGEAPCLLAQERQASEKVFKAYFSQAQTKAGQPLYEDPPPPLTPEGSASQVQGLHTLKQLAAPLKRHGWVGWAALVAAVAATIAWHWPTVQQAAFGDA